MAKTNTKKVQKKIPTTFTINLPVRDTGIIFNDFMKDIFDTQLGTYAAGRSMKLEKIVFEKAGSEIFSHTNVRFIFKDITNKK